jgi:hypothetical protein
VLKVWDWAIGEPIASFSTDGQLVGCVIYRSASVSEPYTLIASEASGQTHQLQLVIPMQGKENAQP